MKKQSNKQSKQSKGNVRVSRATKEPTPAPRTQEQLDAKRAETGKPFDAVVAVLNAGGRVSFPKGANAVKVGNSGKFTVVMKDDADTLKGTGIESVTFGHVPNDSKGRPQRDKFQALNGAVAETKTAKQPKVTKPVEKPANGNPYPTGSKRAMVYDLGATGYKDATAFVEKVVAGLKCGKAKAERLVKLVADPKARFNEGSKAVKADSGMKLVAA